MALQRHWLDHVYDLHYGCIPTSPGCRNCSQMRRWQLRGVPRGYIHPNPAGFSVLRRFDWGRVLHDYEPCLDHPTVKLLVEQLVSQLRVLTMTQSSVTHWILSKHPQRYAERFPRDLLDSSNCLFGVSIETQQYMWRLEELRRLAPRRMIVSAQPLLGPLDFGRLLDGVEFLVLGVECGEKKKRTEAQVEWFDSIKWQCRRWKVDCFILTEPDGKGGIHKIGHYRGEASQEGGKAHKQEVECRRARERLGLRL